MPNQYKRRKTRRKKQRAKEESMELSEIFFSLSLIGFCSLFMYFYDALWLKPEKIRDELRKQGVRGPRPKFLRGNLSDMKRVDSSEKKRRDGRKVAHDYMSIIFPYFDRWTKEYGPTFVYSMGNMVTLYVSNHDLAKEIILCKVSDLGKPSYILKNLGALLGDSIISSNGTVWSHQRKIIAPELFMEKVKGMVELMVESAMPILKSWETLVEVGGGIGDIRIDEDLRNFSADVISRTCFGSNYSKGKELFSRLRNLQKALSKRNFLIGIPGWRYIPTKNNREIWRLDKEIKSLILKLVSERKGGATSERDLLQIILESGGRAGFDITNNFIVDNCKGIYFAGHETTSTSATWCLVLLASNPMWQTRVRREVEEVCRGYMPNPDMLSKMKSLTMVIQETLRLYPASPFVSREAHQDIMLGDIKVPKGTIIWLTIAALHQDPEIWGPDAGTFNPERFLHGVSSASKLPHMYLPFGFGPRTCLGQNFAMVELKMLLSLILSRFTFSLSPSYSHSVAYRLFIEPEFSVNLLMKRV